jgi:hypothetical protein
MVFAPIILIFFCAMLNISGKIRGNSPALVSKSGEILILSISPLYNSNSLILK